MNRTHVLILSALGLAACSRHHAEPVAPAPTPAPTAMAPAPAAPAPVPAMSHADSVRAQVARDEAARRAATTAWGLVSADSQALAQRIRFGYDRSELDSNDIAHLEAKRAVLEKNPALVIKISGNADERGPDEYNLALGLRRAAAAKRWLEFHGIASNRIEIVSYGEEQPLDDGHDEDAWTRNRRDDFLVVRNTP